MSTRTSAPFARLQPHLRRQRRPLLKLCEKLPPLRLAAAVGPPLPRWLQLLLFPCRRPRLEVAQ